MRYYNGVATLYIVGTPIGNLGDMTFRAVDTLKAVAQVACEDTRHTLALLTHFGIKKPLISCRAQNEEKAAQKVIALLNEGKDVAYTSDAGTPGISDPGAVLVLLARAAHHKVVPIPGASALTALVSAAGAGGKTIVFEGFLSPSPGKRRRRIAQLLEGGDAFVLYESPFRLAKCLGDIAQAASQRRVTVGRELTKVHEEIVCGTAEEVLAEFAARKEIKGECAIFVASYAASSNGAAGTDKRQ